MTTLTDRLPVQSRQSDGATRIAFLLGAVALTFAVIAVFAPDTPIRQETPQVEMEEDWHGNSASIRPVNH